MAAKTDTKARPKSRTEDDASGQWTQEEIDAMRDHVQELKAAKKRGKPSKDDRAAGEADLRAKLDGLTGLDREIGEAIHKIVAEVAPELAPRTYYGMPAYSKGGKLICFFQPASKFKVRYGTLGFEVHANMDDGDMFPTSWAITKLTPAVEKQIAALVKQAVS
jgi:uncharacterized protein YdhG (YjbR/CyaY superfamily)